MTASHFTDGYDLSGYLRGEDGFHRPQRYLLHYPNGSKGWYREGDWKLAYRYSDDSFLLFNLATDPTESNDVAASEPARVVRMARAMARELDGKWGSLGTIWPITGSATPRPATDDPFALPYHVDGRNTVDTDGDGLADLLEDIDGDGLVGLTETDSDNPNTDNDNIDDYSELRLDLDPLDPNSSFAVRPSLLSASSMRLAWPSAPGLSFNILYSDDLSTPVKDWAVLIPNVDAHSTLSETTQDIPVGSARRFFSIELLP
ncbi:MAG: hypothetical protein H7A51_19655 [Akkermansiaceae bacterium]|nr:hypothetical protein [Akkermansiaceae bacterium]